MKNFMQPRSGILREIQCSPNPNSQKQRSSRKQKSSKENAPPSDLLSSRKIRSPLPPRAPSSNPNPLKRKLNMETIPENCVPRSDSGVKVIVRMRPSYKEEEGGEMIVQKVSNDSLLILGHTFRFDSVADMDSTQQEIFQLVGAPLVENCLAGFNSSIFAYGQTGSGKTYTMWGPANALLEEDLSSNLKGLTPRVFEQLFARLDEEQVKHADKQLSYQCRCSFLEIYNEQITDLLDPNQRNLQIREDVKSGVYVENLTEEYVYTIKEMTQLLIKGLSNRRTGATITNAESSRSHSVFTCVVESRCKRTADGLSSFRISRINLVDLAGSERQKLTGAAGERLKEAGNINRSLSQLGNLINILAEVSQSGKQRHIPYRDSKLTFLLQESLGGNAKLAMICAISSTQSCKSETLSTLRFAQRAKAIKNKAVVNEVMQDDVNVLREVIRQLKDELLRMKTNGNPIDVTGGYSTSWNARRSLNLLKLSLNHPMTLPHVEDDSDEEMEIDEEAVERVCIQVGPQSDSQVVPFEQLNIKNAIMCNSDDDNVVDCQLGETSEEDKHRVIIESCQKPCLNAQDSSNLDLLNHQCQEESATKADLLNMGSAGESIAVKPIEEKLNSPSNSPILHSPTLSVSPTVNNNSRKSLRTSSSMLSASQKDLSEDERLGREVLHLSFARSLKSNSSNSPSSETCKNALRRTQHIAENLHRGLQIIDNHCQSSVTGRSSFRFSLKPEDLKPLPVVKVDVGVQTLPLDSEESEYSSSFLCGNCNSRAHLEFKEANGNFEMQLTPVDGTPSADKSKKQVPKAVEKVLAGAIRREMALEEFCAKQTSEIMHLSRLVQQYKHERECNAIIGQTREDKIIQLEGLMDGVLPIEEFMEEEVASLTNELKILKLKYDNHPEVLRAKIELKRVQNELDGYRNFFDMGERDVLMEEIQHLRSQLQYYVDASLISARKESPVPRLTYSCEPSSADLFEQERNRWTEAENKWISLSEELRIELEASHVLAEKTRHELDSEKKCSEELKEAMQMAMQGHARILEQYVELQEKYLTLLAGYRQMQEGIDDVKRAATKAGVKGAESKFINSLAAEISALKVEREKERKYFIDENKGLQSQLRDTAEAVQAAGELLVRLKEAEETAAIAQRRAVEAEQEAEKAYIQIDKLKKKHEREMTTLNQSLAESRLPKEPTRQDCDMAKYDGGQCLNAGGGDRQWREEFQKSYSGEDGEFSKLNESSSWFSGYDRCNI